MRRKILRYPPVLTILLLYCQLASPAESSERPAVRVTTGVTEVKGWENSLVRRNPSLSHWHWNPIYVYRQGMNSNRPSRPNFNHKNPNLAKSPGTTSNQHYIKPIHMPFSPEATEKNSGFKKVDSQLANASLTGSINKRRPESAQTLKGEIAPLPILRAPSYEPLATESGTSNSRSVALVQGKLKTPSVHALKAVPKALKLPNKLERTKR